MGHHSTLEITKGTENGGLHFSLQGALLGGHLEIFQKCMDEALQASPRAVYLELSNLAIIDSRGLGALVEWFRRYSQENIAFRLKNANGAVLRALQLTNLSSLFGLVPELDGRSDEIRRQRQALWASHEYIEQIMLALGEGVIGLSTSGDILYANPAAEGLLGMPETQLIGKSFCNSIDFLETSPNPDALLPWCISEVARGTRRVYRADVVIVRGRGEKIPCRLNATAITCDGTPAGAIIGLNDLTEREQANKCLNETYRRYQDLVQTTGDMVCTIGLSGRLTFVSNPLLRALGYGTEDLAKVGIASLLPDADRDRALQYFQKRFQRKPARSLQCNLLTRDGRILPVEIIANPFDAPDGKLEGIQAIVFDVTDRQAALQALEISEKRLRAIAEYSPEAIIFYRGHDNRVDYANPACVELSGYSLEEFYGERPPQLAHPEELHEGLVCVEKCMRGELVPFRESRLVTKSGDIKWVETSYVPLFENKTVQFGFMSITRDMTERKQAEMALAASEERYRRMLAAVTSYTFSVDCSEGEVRVVHSEGSNAVLGWTPEELDADPLITLNSLHPEDREMVLSHFQKIMEGEMVPAITFRVYQKNGNLRWLRLTTASCLGAKGELLRYDALVEDITDHRKMEEELRQAQKMESIGQLAGGIAHDFNNLLTGILGNLSLAELEAPTHVRRLLGEAQKAGQRAADLVRKLLAFSRKSQMTMWPVLINPLVREVADFSRETFSKRIEIQFEEDEDTFPVLGDGVQLHQVLLNLCVNARDSIEEAMQHNPMGRARITIAARNTIFEGEACPGADIAPGTPCVEISVADTGIGMDSETAKRIFDPFFTTKEGRGGTGLGLASVYGIVRQHNGTIHVESQPGEGATFRICLPAASVEGSAPVPREINPAVPEGNEMILLVDDEEMIRSIGHSILSHLGYDVLLATNGKEAVDIYQERQEEIALTILDISMPVLSGIEALAQIRAINPDALVIMSSGYADAYHNQASTSGPKPSAFVSKPYRLIDMAHAVRNTLDGTAFECESVTS